MASVRRRMHDLRLALRASVARHPFDLVAIVAPQNRGWILDAIAREVLDRSPGRAHLDYSSSPPPAHAYFFTHYDLYRRHHRQLRRGSRSVVWFTHPSYAEHDETDVVRSLSSATWVASSCTPHAEALVRAGVPRGRVRVVLPGADATLFRPHDRGRGAVGFSSAYYQRKRPELIVEIVQSMPERRFELIGRNWPGTPELAALQQLPNFSYCEDTYASYPQFYDGIDVFVSPSSLEGGPIPVLEAMMSNAVPVASDTGFARDLIRDGENGFICATDADPSDYCGAIEKAFSSSTDVRSTVEHLTWDRFAREILELLRDR